MSLRFTLFSIACLTLLLAFAPAADAQQVVEMEPGTWVTDITPDGNIVTGSGPGGAFRWEWRVDPAPTYIGGHGGTGISDDGSVIVGNMDDPTTGDQVAGRWTNATGWVPLGGVATCGSISSAYDVSGDGTQVVGLIWAGCSGRGFLWDTTNGMQQLQDGGNGQNRATVINTLGTHIGGFAQGSFNRTPVYWDAATLTGFAEDLDDQGEVYGFNDNGSWSVGTYYFGSGSWLKAFIRDETNGQYINLGSLYNDWGGNATDVSEDGSTICGYDVQGLARDAWVWTDEEGIVSMEDFASDLGILTATDFLVCTKMSDDGNVIVGGYDPEGIAFGGGFILEIESDSAWTDLGGGTAGSNGVPSLSGTGSLDPNTVFSMDLVNAPPFAQMLVWISLTSTPVNAFGGTIHAFPPNTEFLFPANGAGEFSAASLWPTGIPSGTDLYFQFLIGDATALPWGITLSNGLQATTP